MRAAVQTINDYTFVKTTCVSERDEARELSFYVKVILNLRKRKKQSGHKDWEKIF